MAKKQAAPETTALAVYDEELAQIAQASAAQEANVGGGQFISTRGGHLSFGGAPIKNDRLAAIVLDGVLLNTFYDSGYSEDDKRAPVCYAFGRDEDTMAPHPEAEQPQSEGCAACPQNQYGTASTGRGKACTNRRRLAVIAAGDLDDSGNLTAIDDPTQVQDAEVALLQLAPTSLKGYAKWVKGLASGAAPGCEGKKLPPFAVFCEIGIGQGPKGYVVTFETIGPVPGNLLQAVIARHKQVREEIIFPFQRVEAAPQPAPKAAAKPRAVRAVKTATPATAPVPQRTAGRASSGAAAPRAAAKY